MSAADPKLLEAALKLEDTVGLAWLYEVEVPTDPPTRARLTSYSRLIYYGTYGAGASVPGDPIPYYPASIKLQPIRENASGDLPQLRVTIGNARRQASDLLETHNGLRGQPARILLVRLDALDDPSAHAAWEFTVDRARASEEAVTIDLSRARLNRLQDPPWRYARASCRFPFGGPRCGYQIPNSPGETVGTGFSTCAHTYSACVERGLDEVARGLTSKHPLRFGGKRGIPGS